VLTIPAGFDPHFFSSFAEESAMNTKLGPGIVPVFFAVCFTLVLLVPRLAVAQKAEDSPAPPPKNEEKAKITEAESPSVLEVAEIILAESYDPVNKAPVGAATTFDAGLGKVICYTRIKGVQETAEITHVWYYDGKTMAKVPLHIGSPNWRTYSSKNLLPSWTGKWEVRILDEGGAVLATAEFTVQ
jgi:hypothetical protein